MIDSRNMRAYTRNMIRCYCSLLRLASRKLSSVYGEALAPLGINIAQYSLLKAIQRLQPVSFTELGRNAELDRSTIGRNVRVLERIGLVETGRDDGDHREAVVTLSPQGAQRLEEAMRLWEGCQSGLEAKLGPAKIKALQDILGSL